MGAPRLVYGALRRCYSLSLRALITPRRALSIFIGNFSLFVKLRCKLVP